MRRRASAVAAALLLVAAVGNVAEGAAAVEPEVERLGFDDAVRRALARNPTIALAREELDRAAALVEQSRAPALPTLAANATYQRLDHDRLLPGTTSVVAPADQVNANLVLTLPLFHPARWLKWRQTKDNVLVAAGALEDAARQLALATARVYLSLVAQERIVDVATRARDSARAHADFAHQRFAGGFGTRIDEVRAAGEVAVDEAQLQVAWAQRARLREALGLLVGSDHAIDATDTIVLPAPLSVEEALAAAVSERRDVRLLHQRLEAAERVERDSWADFLPTLTGVLQPFYQQPATTQLPTWGWQAQLTLSWLLYDGGARYGLRHERAALFREAHLNLEGGLRQVRSDVRVADEELRRAKATLAAAREAARLAGEGLTLANLAYRAGASTNIEVIDAERRARDAESAVTQAEDGFRQATLDLLLASGRFPSRP